MRTFIKRTVFYRVYSLLIKCMWLNIHVPNTNVHRVFICVCAIIYMSKLQSKAEALEQMFVKKGSTSKDKSSIVFSQS